LQDFSRFPPADAPDDSSVLGRLEETKLQELRGTSCPAVASPSTEVASGAADAMGLAKEKDEQGVTGFDKSWVRMATMLLLYVAWLTFQGCDRWWGDTVGEPCRWFGCG
jgi:hypothetical protein